jgi:F-type H+-transporting ATPase subunit b
VILSRAREEAEEQKKRLLDAAREEVAETRANWQRQASQEKEEFLVNLQRGTTVIIEAIARKALNELADTDLEERIAGRFTEKLKALDEDVRQSLAGSPGPVNIVSAFELDSTVRSGLTRAVHEYLAEDLEVHYSQSKELLCGIELTCGGRRLSWNLEDYLDGLAAGMEEIFMPVGAMTERS